MPMLRASAPARIVSVASAGQSPIDLDDPMLEQGYDAMGAYTRSKLAQVMFTMELAGRLQGTGVTVKRVGIRARPDGRIKHLPIEDQQMLAFGKALYIEHARVILLDEITATLPRERKISFLEFLRAEVERSPELSFTLISHHIDEIMKFCDRVTVMRDGKAIGPLVVKETSKAELADLITGGVAITTGGGTR